MAHISKPLLSVSQNTTKHNNNNNIHHNNNHNHNKRTWGTLSSIHTSIVHTGQYKIKTLWLVPASYSPPLPMVDPRISPAAWRSSLSSPTLVHWGSRCWKNEPARGSKTTQTPSSRYLWGERSGLDQSPRPCPRRYGIQIIYTFGLKKKKKKTSAPSAPSAPSGPQLSLFSLNKPINVTFTNQPSHYCFQPKAIYTCISANNSSTTSSCI